jgi:hypothetical protein
VLLVQTCPIDQRTARRELRSLFGVAWGGCNEVSGAGSCTNQDPAGGVAMSAAVGTRRQYLSGLTTHGAGRAG